MSLIESWDDETRTYTREEDGVKTTRPYTTEENIIADREQVYVMAQRNKATIEDQAATALGTNATFLAIASPTNAQIAAQVKALTRQNNGIIRLILNKLDGTS